MKSRYYIRVYPADADKFAEYLSRNKISATLLSIHIGADGGSNLHSVYLDEDEALAIKLSFNLIGLLNFTQTLNGQVARRAVTYAKIPHTNLENS